MIGLLNGLARLSAGLAGVLLTSITLLTVVSVVGRDVFSKGINGDFELVGVITGAAVALFMPWCQAKRGHIIVDFFTAKVGDQTNAWLDRAGALLMAAFMGVLTWRTTLGGLNAWNTKSGSMMLGFPEWITYSFIVPPLALAALIALAQAAVGFERFGSEGGASA